MVVLPVLTRANTVWSQLTCATRQHINIRIFVSTYYAAPESKLGFVDLFGSVQRRVYLLLMQPLQERHVAEKPTLIKWSRVTAQSIRVAEHVLFYHLNVFNGGRPVA